MSDNQAIHVAKPMAGFGALVLPLFSLTIFLSAFLLFSVQPLFARMVLPKLGGTPAVWSVAMVFFQAMLLAGYGYAHFLTKRLNLRVAAVVHIAVMACALVFLPIAVSEAWGQPPQSGQAIWLLGLFAVSVGLPFFAVSANGPLLQAWFHRTGHPHAHDPYFLYGASNIGSFASLVLYVAFFEPAFVLQAQSAMWAGGFIALGAAIAACALAAGRGTLQRAAAEQADPVEAGPRTQAGWRTRLQWVWLAFVPSGLMVAVTAHISVDVAAIPLLWIVPLSLYLMTFVFAFARRPVVPVRFLDRALPALGFGALAVSYFNLFPLVAQMLIQVVFFFAAALLAHSVLASKRPAASDLTNFYFWMSTGGVLGGVFASLLAPVLFDWIAEYPLLVLAALLIRPSIWAEDARPAWIVSIAGLILLFLAGSPFGPALFSAVPTDLTLMAFIAFAAAGSIVHLRAEPAFVASVMAFGVLCFGLQMQGNQLFMERSFFGVLKARLSEDGEFMNMSHGTTIHGSMRVDETGTPTPLTYYHASGGIARALFSVQRRKAGEPAEIGVVGLGVGSLICHRSPGERWTHFEIDADVVRLARDPEYFRFMSSCEMPDDRMVIGDARLKLADEPDRRFDYLLIDAFSSDSIPIHLLTTEAFDLYRDKLAERGLLVVHISNRYMELATVLAAIARETGMAMRAGKFIPDAAARDQGATTSMVAVLARDERDLAALAADNTWQPVDPGRTAAWTDGYSNVPAAILRKSWYAEPEAK
ncbi:fused MFS/spermidine synthase [Oricola thermophila]|uniref:Fused MFS/spermidine synthase n=1 Tax=Oricola thermophila TaxID=2742145 RepID=A0A6N1VER0_9HYPH|nr:fused MFS/spermidine synthase [Oricola thermophila]QKV17497.1 fused MFS/spermidine synthase [Oricola thermophila]